MSTAVLMFITVTDQQSCWRGERYSKYTRQLVAPLTRFSQARREEGRTVRHSRVSGVSWARTVLA